MAVSCDTRKGRGREGSRGDGRRRGRKREIGVVLGCYATSLPSHSFFPGSPNSQEGKPTGLHLFISSSSSSSFFFSGTGA
jgi:hypothetical protein